MQGIFYEKYIREYRNALNTLHDRKNIQNYREKLEDERKQKFIKLKELINELTQVKMRQSELANIEETIKTKSVQIVETQKKIEENKEICKNKQVTIMGYVKVINRFRKEFNNEFKLNEEKYQELNMLEILHLSRQRIILYQLGSYLLNDVIAEYIFNGVYELHNDFRDQRKEKINTKSIYLLEINLSLANKETEISTGLGYCALLLNTLSKYLNIPLKYPMYFCGSMSIIMRKQNENYPLYIMKVFDKNKFNIANRNLIQNILQVLEYFEVNVSERRISLRKQMETLIKILQGGRS